MSKGDFFIGQPIFSQLLKLIPRNMALSVGKAFEADRYCKRFTTYDHLVTMLYVIFNQCSSLREVTTGMLAWEGRLQHLGVRHHPCRCTLSDANKRRPSAIFEAIYLKLIGRLGPFLSDSRPGKSSNDRLYIFDATTITLFQEVLQGSGLRGYDGRRKGGIKVHTLMRSDLDVPTMIRFSPAACTDSGFLKQVQLPAGATVVFDRGYNHYATFNQLSAQRVNWVTRLRSRLVYEVLKENSVTEQQQAKGIVADALIVLGADTSRAKGQDRQEIEFFGKFILCSNNEDNFIQIDTSEIRYWIRGQPSLNIDNRNLLSDLKTEIPVFIHYLIERPFTTQPASRMCSGRSNCHDCTETYQTI